ncbi:MAG TPA: lytic transglycosylase domain-containing protein [Acetobacteraceae bacterium]|nr:lytic transglycosylase domain-containing protein [Acetobacteraceae bacterium]
MRAFGALAVLALLSACAGHPQVSERQAASHYLARAKSNYTPPGPPDDPWGPYIAEASIRFDVPERWIREVMRVESGGREFLDGEPITSDKGAMGLMQVMPETYQELEAQYGLGDDPYDPHNSILAGTAYIRELYDIYGSPGFLAAYNAGPGRLDDYLAGNSALPGETRRYVAMIGPYIEGTYPARRSPAELLAVNTLPVNIPPGRRWSVHTRYAEARVTTRHHRVAGPPVEVAELPEPPRPHAWSHHAAVRQATYTTDRHGRRVHLLDPAMAEPIPLHHPAESGGHWAIQVGAYGNRSLAHAALTGARQQARVDLAGAHVSIGTVKVGHSHLYRARLTGLSRAGAIQACQRISHRSGCMVLAPDSQS